MISIVRIVELRCASLRPWVLVPRRHEDHASITGVRNNAVAVIGSSHMRWRVSDVRRRRRDVFPQRFPLAREGGKRLRRSDAEHGGSRLVPCLHETPTQQCVRRPSDYLYGFHLVIEASTAFRLLTPPQSVPIFAALQCVGEFSRVFLRNQS